MEHTDQHIQDKPGFRNDETASDTSISHGLLIKVIRDMLGYCKASIRWVPNQLRQIHKNVLSQQKSFATVLQQGGYFHAS
jgi:hypothetical protein